MYKVLQRFRDLKDDNHIYKENDIFPRRGANVSPERIQELLSPKNKIGKPVIQKIENEQPKKDKPKPKKG